MGIVGRVAGETGGYVSQKICNVHKPDLGLELVDCDSAVKGGQEITIKIAVPSIYGIKKYTNASMQVDCPLIENTSEKLQDILADGSGVIEKSFTIKSAKKAKKCELVITFNSKEVSGVHGSLVLDVTP